MFRNLNMPSLFARPIKQVHAKPYQERTQWKLGDLPNTLDSNAHALSNMM